MKNFLKREHLEKFINEIKDKKDEENFGFRIKVLSSMYSYLIVFMNRFLDFLWTFWRYNS